MNLCTKWKYVLCDWLLRVEHEVIMEYFLCASNTRSTMECVCAFVIVWRACILVASALIVHVCVSNTNNGVRIL